MVGMFNSSSFGTVTPAEMERFRAWIEVRKRELEEASTKKSNAAAGKKCSRSRKAKTSK